MAVLERRPDAAEAGAINNNLVLLGILLKKIKRTKEKIGIIIICKLLHL